MHLLKSSVGKRGEKYSGSEKGKNNLPEIQRRFGDWIYSYLSPRQSVGTRRKTQPLFFFPLASVETVRKKGGQHRGEGSKRERESEREKIKEEKRVWRDWRRGIIWVGLKPLIQLSLLVCLHTDNEYTLLFLFASSRHAAKSHGNFKH